MRGKGLRAIVVDACMEQLQKGVLATDSKDVQHLSVYNTYKETHTHIIHKYTKSITT